MINFLAITRNCIPYIRELRAIAGSATATILMQQLDFWFNTSPEGFYKFLAPCEHACYREGDSWVEELGFSKAEFRVAFDKIGVRYTSKTQFLSSFNRGSHFVGDDGEEKFYCSYHDKIKNTTFYLRNHQKTDQALTSLLGLQTPINSRDSQTEFTEVNKLNLRKSTNLTYVSKETESLLYTENTTETTTESKTRAHAQEEPKNQVPPPPELDNQNQPPQDYSSTVVSQPESQELTTNLSVEIIPPADENDNDSQNPHFENLVNAYEAGEIKDLPGEEKKQLADYLMGEMVSKYRRSGRILSPRPNDINQDFVRFVAWKELKQPQDLQWARNTITSYERDMSRWCQLGSLVDDWLNADMESITREAVSRANSGKGTPEDKAIARKYALDNYEKYLRKNQ